MSKSPSSLLTAVPEKASLAGPSPATAEALKKAPEAVKRSMPMALSIGIGILLAGVVGWLFYYLTWFILVLYLSFVAATVLEAPVQWLRRAGIRRRMAAPLIMGGGLLLAGSLAFALANGIFSQFGALSANLERAPEHINHFVNDLKEHFPWIGQRLGDFDVAGEIVKATPGMAALGSRALSGVLALSWLVIMFFIVLYMLMDGADHLKGIRAVLPKGSRLEATQLFHELARAHRGWALASLSNVVSSTLLIGTGLYLVGIPGAFILGFVEGLGELIPNIGPLLGALPALVITLLGEPDKFVYVLGVIIVMQTIQSYTISPLMLRFSIELPVLVTILSVLVFGVLFGFLGICAAIPLVADLVVLWQYLDRHMEKDTADYDEVNGTVTGPRAAMAADNTSPSRLRRMFRRRKRQEDPVPSANVDSPEPSGMDRLTAAEQRAAPRGAP